MAKVQGKVTQEGWSFEFETDESDNQASTGIAQEIARTFVIGQSTLQAEGQRFIRETFQTQRPEEIINGHSHQEAENLGFIGHSDETLP